MISKVKLKREYIRGLKIIVGIITAITVFCGIVWTLNYMYVNPEDSRRPRLVLHDFYENKGQIDNLYLGSSHVYSDINPMYLDNINKRYNFNLSTPGQLLNGTFYLLREADRYNNLSHVYVELYYYLHVQAGISSGDERIYANFYRTWQNSDYMNPSVNKLVYMFSIARPEQYTDLCLPFSRYRTKLADWDYIEQVMNKKQTEDYLNYKYRSETEEYMGKGYFAFSAILDDCDKIYKQLSVLDNNPIGETSEHYLRSTIEYCQARDIPLTLFISPIYELQLISTENYDNYIDEVKAIAEEYNIEFYDFNLAKEEYLPIQLGDYFRDTNHLNSVGANMYTSFFYEVVSGDEVDKKKYFYDSYAEKLQRAAPELYGIYYRNTEEADASGMLQQTRIMWVASNREEDMEYRIIMTPEDGEQYMVQDFNENKQFTTPVSESGICTVVARMKESPDEVVQTMEINY